MDGQLKQVVMQKDSKSSADGDGFSPDEDEFYDAVELLEDDLDCSETRNSSYHDTRSSGVEGDDGVGPHHDVLNICVEEGGLEVDGETVAAAATSPTAPPVNLDSSLSLCQSASGINSPLADSKNQVENQHHASMNCNVELESEHAVEDSIVTNDEGEKNPAASTMPTLTKILTPINLHSSPCRGYNIESPLEALYSIGSQGGKMLPPSFSPTRTSCVIESDDEFLGGIRPLPIIDNENTANQDAGQLELNWPDNSDSDSDSFSVEKRYQIVNKDTGKVHDVRQVMKDIPVSGSSDILDTNYSLLPSRAKLEHQQTQRICRSSSKDSDDSGTHLSTRRIHWYNSKDSDDSREQPSRRWIHLSNSKDSIDNETHAIPSTVDSGASKEEKTSEPKKGGMKFKMPKQSSKMAENVRKGMSELKKSGAQKINKKRTSSADMVPSNAVYVRSSSRPAQTRSASSGSAGDSQDTQNESSFNPMLLIKTIPDAHKGPAWCASFSQNGRFLATGGGDGNVCIWAVSPKSKVIHPDGVQIHQDDADTDTLSEQNFEKKECVTKDEEKDNASSPVPPLHFIGTGPALAANLEILSSEPIRRFKDHTAHVIDLSWSRSDFLLSASLDSSVRLYHYSKPQCLHCFSCIPSKR